MVLKQKLETALRSVRAWCEAMLASTATPALTTNRGFRFWRDGEGTLILDGDDAEQYGLCLDALVEAVADTDQASPRAIELVLQSALFTVFDIPKKRSPDLQVRLDEAIKQLRQFLLSQPRRFRIVVPVNGLDVDGLPTKVGMVEFAVFDEPRIELFRRSVSGIPDDQKEEVLKLIEDDIEREELRNGTVAITEVDALDWGAAQLLAVREIRLTLDVINFFSDLVRYNDAHLSLRGDAPTIRFVSAQLRQEEGRWARFAFEGHWVGGMGKVSLLKFRKQDAAASMGFERGSQLLAGPKRNELEDRLLASLQWAGRATVATRNEEALLFYMVALESYVLAGKDTNQELSYSLRLRVAHLLGSTLEQRHNVLKKMKELYGTRSKIVHDGHSLVTDADRGLMRAFTKTCLVRALTWKELVDLASRDELREWFTDRFLQIDPSDKE